MSLPPSDYIDKKTIIPLTVHGIAGYRGQRAYRLFLQVYQLILWKQCYALIHERGFPSQTEVSILLNSQLFPLSRYHLLNRTGTQKEVVRDLWALRLDTFSEKLAGPAESTGDEPEVFSSQPSAPETEDDEAFKLSHRRTTWPRLIDSVGLCYLGALLLRLPVTIADMHRCACPCGIGHRKSCLTDLVVFQNDHAGGNTIYQNNQVDSSRDEG